MKKPHKSLVWLMFVCLLAGGLLASAPVGRTRAATSPAPLMTLDTTGLSAALDSQSVTSGQDVITNWTDTSGNTFTIAGPEGTVLYLGTDTDGVPYAKVSPPLISTSTTMTGDQAIAQYVSSGFSLYNDALAVGYSSTDAQGLVNQANASGRIISHICISTKWSGAGTHECDVQHLLQHSGSHDWYIGNQTLSSVWRRGFSAVYWFRTYVTYDHHDNIDWNPSATQYTDCSSVTESASAPNGVGISATQKVCGNELDPFFPPINGFGAVWTDGFFGAECNSTVNAAPSASVEYDAGGASTDNYSLWVKAKSESICPVPA